jgi:hypothetical protein
LETLNILLCVLEDGEALAGIAKMPGESRGGEDIGSVGALEEHVVDVGRGIVRFRWGVSLLDAVGRILMILCPRMTDIVYVPPPLNFSLGLDKWLTY